MEEKQKKKEEEERRTKKEREKKEKRERKEKIMLRGATARLHASLRVAMSAKAKGSLAVAQSAARISTSV